MSAKGDTKQHSIQDERAMEVDEDSCMGPPMSIIDALAAQAARTVLADSESLAIAGSRGDSESLDDMSPLSQELRDANPADCGNPNIDFSTAPSDPIELAWWVAQQITHFQTEVSEPPEVRSDVGQKNSLSHPPGVRSRKSLADLEPQQVIEREKLRLENRERKKRWRGSNTERSTFLTFELADLSFSSSKATNFDCCSDKDNDLRCRLNKRAKTKFGSGTSVAKTAYIETEFNKRRTKREIKQRARAIAIGEFPGFAIAPELTDRLFSTQNSSVSKEVQAAGNLLMSTLLGVGSKVSLGAKKRTSNSLKVALEDGTLNPKPLVEALKIMASNRDLMRGINSKLDYDGEDEELEMLSGDDNENQPMQRADARAGSVTSQSSAMNHQSTEIIKALHAATALLNEMTDTKVYASPYGNPPPIVAGVNGYGTPKTNGAGPPSSSKQEVNGHGLDQSQIDALLALANGGSLTDDEDDKTIADPDELNAEQLDVSDIPQTDGDITATLQRIINQLMAERDGGQSANDRRDVPTTAAVLEPYGSQSVRDQAATLQSLFSQAGVSINTIMPREQSHATSQLYAHLSSRARSSTPSGGINPAHASAYGNTAQMQQRMLAKPGIFGQAHHSQTHPLQAVSSTSRGNVVGPPARPKNPEELMKIKCYGFPPLPGNRPGVKKQ